jgi:hypothetical protein
MKGLFKRKITPSGKKFSSGRVKTDTERADEHFGATEPQVTPLTPPSAVSPEPDERRPSDQLNPNEEITPG